MTTRPVLMRHHQRVPREFLDDAFGPDGVRVTVAVEQAADRSLRRRDSWYGPNLINPVSRWLRKKNDQFVQKYLFDDAWAVDVEADSGERARVIRPTREGAQSLALSFRSEVIERGVSAIADLR